MDNYELVDSFSPTQRLTPNRAPGISIPLLHQDMPRLSPNRWQDSSSREGNHRTFGYKQQVPSLTEKVLAVAKLLALPILASAYLVFCIIVNKRLITLKNHGFYAFTPDHIATIKAGVTSLSQLVVFAALYPVADIVSKLQSEEFFRILGSSRMQGVPLAILDEKSNPNYGFMRFLNEAFSRTSSIYMFSAFVAALIGVAISWVTPAALNVATVLVESETVALAVGAVPAQGVYNASIPLLGLSGWDAYQNNALASSVLWSEMELGANYSFSVAGSDAEFAAYIVPSPIDLTTTVSAHWMTDVVGMNPTCEWASTNISSTTQLQGNQSNTFSLTAGVYLQNLGLDVSITSVDYGLNMLAITAMDPLYGVFNHSTQGPATDGSTVFAVSQCFTGCSNLTFLDPVVLNWTNIPTFTLDVNANAYNQAQTWTFAFLACRPNAVIQTREVFSNGTGFLEVLPVRQGKQYISQGNLHPTQTPLMLSLALSGITFYAGPINLSTTPAGSYSTVQNDFLFGREQMDALPRSSFGGPPTVVTILPTDTLAKTFGGMLQSVSKTYLAGFLGTAHVPAKVFSPKVVFVSSMPFIIASAVMFGILFVLVIIMHFRRHEKAFTLVSVSAALHGSNLPKHFALAEKSQALATVSDQRVVLQKGEDGTSVLRIIAGNQ
ncbi:hypothetical protein EV702DRAFT_1111675 [Suillus placidus]|uniref:Uncharacterized protein n=1 Tax=Suillus placidus TaxID=48579 RepID=A0A9P6ZTN4_9AGAM|nr:hypothetical protein EV702DRAFT_1111675 [Suillus placidus]